MKPYTDQLHLIINLAKIEEKRILDEKNSAWDYKQIHYVIIPEMEDILSGIEHGKLFFKYGKKQRMLESTYIMTDSLHRLNETILGKEISKLQMMINRF